MSRIRKIFELSKKDTDHGDHPTAADSSVQNNAQSIDDGIYVITNVYHNRFVYLEDPNDNTPLRGHHRPGNPNSQWRVTFWGNEQYSIENFEHNRYANCGPLARLKASVEGQNDEQLWRIQARPTGEYTIATTDTRNLWMLPYDDPGTPVELFNVHTDPRCWWTFKEAATVAPANENATIQTTLFEPKLLLIPSGGQRTPDLGSEYPRSRGRHTPDPRSSSHRTLDLGLDLISAIAEATDLFKPLKATREALEVVLQKAKNIGQVSEEWKIFIKGLNFHLATIENDISKLEEDREIDRETPDFDQAVRGPLETYARELEEIYQLVMENQPTKFFLLRKITQGSRNRKMEVVTGKKGNMGDLFQRYTASLHLFAASTISRMQPEMSQFHGESLQEAKKKHLNQLKVSNAYGVQHVPCIPGTRLKTLQVIRDWVDDETSTKSIFFLLDAAGSGKSTVAKHMAEKWKREKRMLARFFFSRDTMETMSTSSFCSTVAGAFAHLDPDFKVRMDKFMEQPNAGLLPFEELFDGLVIGPLKAIGRHAILIIDALDECHPEQRNQLLETLHRQHGSIPLLRILATGRPERDIKRWAEEKFTFGYTNFTRLEGDDKDVELYIKHRLQGVPIIQDRLYPVIRHAEGLFIWARIACDLLVDSDDIDGLLEELGKEVSLDYLYKVALGQSMPKEGISLRAMVLVLQMILAAREPLSIAELEMLSPKRGIVENVVTRLGSVLLYQGRDDPVRLLHATFREFLTARSKADIFFIQPELGHHTLASGCLNAIGDVFKQDESTLRNPGQISDRQTVSFLARYLLTVYPGFSFTRQTHGSIIV